MSKQIEALIKQRTQLSEVSLTSLNALLEQELPEAAKSKIKDLRDQINAKLSELPPIEMVDGASEAGWALNHLERVYKDFISIMGGMQNRVQEIIGSLSSEATALNSKVADFESRLTNGELVTKEDHEEKINLAKQTAAEEGRTVALNQFEQRNGRLEQLREAKLPVPADAILDSEEFETALNTAKERLPKLVEANANITNAPRMLNNALWGSDEEFNKVLEDAKGMAGSVTARNRAPSATAGAHPMAGGSGDAAGQDEKAPMAFC